MKSSESPADDHAGRTAWGLCRETVSSQGLISPTLAFHFASKDSRPASHHILLQIKEPTASFVHMTACVLCPKI